MPYKWLDILGGRTYTTGNNVQKALIQLLIFKKIFPVVLVEIYLVFPLLSTSIAFKSLSLVRFLEMYFQSYKATSKTRDFISINKVASIGN
jgi:hypothetical protein